jgi:hypothetical protein
MTVRDPDITALHDVVVIGVQFCSSMSEKPIWCDVPSVTLVLRL